MLGAPWLELGFHFAKLGSFLSQRKIKVAEPTPHCQGGGDRSGETLSLWKLLSGEREPPDVRQREKRGACEVWGSLPQGRGRVCSQFEMTSLQNSGCPERGTAEVIANTPSPLPGEYRRPPFPVPCCPWGDSDWCWPDGSEWKEATPLSHAPSCGLLRGPGLLPCCALTSWC